MGHTLTHWGWVTHICVGKLIIIGSDNGLLPDLRQAIIRTNAGLLSIGPLRTYFSENFIKIQQFSLKKLHVKMSFAKCRPSCLGLNVLNVVYICCSWWRWVMTVVYVFGERCRVNDTQRLGRLLVMWSADASVRARRLVRGNQIGHGTCWPLLEPLTVLVPPHPSQVTAFYLKIGYL